MKIKNFLHALCIYLTFIFPIVQCTANS